MSTLTTDHPDLFSDEFSEFYQEVLKHELCLIRFNDICEKINDKYYVPSSKYNVAHNFDATLTILDLAYLYLNYYKRGSADVGGLLPLIDYLKSARLLIDLPCTDNTLDKVLEAASNNPVLEINIGSDNVFRHFKILDRIRRKGESVLNEVLRLVNERRDSCFKTAYGELLRLFRYENSLPYSQGELRSPYYVLEAFLLPFIEDYIPNNIHDVDILCERENRVICEALKFEGVKKLNSYQFEMIKQLREKINEPKLGIISAPTGSGKTYIFTVYLLMKLLRFGGAGLLIYPTKTLAREQLEKLVKLVYYINKFRERKIHLYILDGNSKNQIPDNDDFRGGMELKINNSRLRIVYRKGKPCLVNEKDEIQEEIDWISEYKKVERIEEPAVVISNHSMISNHLTRNIGENHWIVSLLDKLNTLVIDEAHIFLNSKDLSDFIHFLLLRIFLYIISGEGEIDLDEGIRKIMKQRVFDVLISSATMENRNILEDNFQTSQLAGIDLSTSSGLAGIDSGPSSEKDKQSPDLSPIFRGPLKDLFDSEIFVRYYSTFDRKESKRKLVVTSLFFPSPSTSSTTHFIEALNTSLLWTLGVGRGVSRVTKRNYEPHVLAFIDSKETQEEVFRNLVRRGLRKEEFHKDKLLIDKSSNQGQGGEKFSISKKMISILRENAIKSMGNKLDAGYQTFLRYSHLQLFLDSKEIDAYLLGNLDEARSKELKDLAEEISVAARGLKKDSFIHHNEKHFFVIKHNADLDEVRNRIEAILSQKIWNVCISTSTLEVGVNLNNVNVVMQHGIPSSSESYIQRLGRSGRTNESFRISFGTIFLKNMGKDISFLDEGRAFRELFNIERKNFGRDFDRETLIRYGVLIHAELERLFPGKEYDGLREIMKRYVPAEADRIVETIKEILDNKRELLRNIPDSKTDNVGIHSLSGLNYELIRSLATIFALISGDGKTRLAGEIHSIIDKLNQYSMYGDISTLVSQKLMWFYGYISDVLSRVKKDPKLMRMPNVKKEIERANSILKKIISLNLTDMFTTHNEINLNLDERINFFLLGNRIPHPAIITDIQGTRIEIDESNIEVTREKNIIVVDVFANRNLRTLNRNRSELLRNIPFKYYG
ncbi:putative ATP-dependent RNA helicase [Metallosphaera sp. J1]|uniref:DEAD/DEAH box helicase n=1 Tax=Metallosphaera javensis (ex Hofmann et al. 2022) TaxID=99938 RepID=UPI001EE06DC3|nr:DEAD/DEAH box helicase [Metallosphaera javensis (ex Hofmann et al. 2022)]MCG3110069.1 putative ATP-dependent RNA helicase [Metallosphaera javensis (ex Hofmann et al. 2022)]